MNDITPVTNIATDGGEHNLSDQAKPLSCERSQPMRSLFGENSLMTAESAVSIVPSLETNPRICRASLSDRLTESLISHGLVKGIIHTSLRTKSNQQILVAVFCEQDGSEPSESPSQD